MFIRYLKALHKNIGTTLLPTQKKSVQKKIRHRCKRRYVSQSKIVFLFFYCRTTTIGHNKEVSKTTIHDQNLIVKGKRKFLNQYILRGRGQRFCLGRRRCQRQVSSFTREIQPTLLKRGPDYAVFDFEHAVKNVFL